MCIRDRVRVPREFGDRGDGQRVGAVADGKRPARAVEAGFTIRQPGCSACLAMNDDKIPAGKYSVSTSNRNFEGRQGPGACAGPRQFL